MIEDREFRDRIRESLKIVSAQQLADSLYVSRSCILRWADGVNLPKSQVIRKRLLDYQNLESKCR